MRFEADDLPWTRCLLYVEQGKYDAVLDDNNKSPNLITAVNPTTVYPVAIYVRQDFPSETLSWSALHGKKLGLVRGYEYPESIKLNKAGFIVDDSIDDAAMIRKLKSKRYDYMVSDAFSVLPLTQQEGVEVKMLQPILGGDYLYLTFNKKHYELMRKFDDVLGQMIKDGTVDAMYKKYLPYTYDEVIKLHK
jgi:polar amino acid transport system substrate-binding protein